MGGDTEDATPPHSSPMATAAFHGAKKESAGHLQLLYAKQLQCWGGGGREDARAGTLF